MIRVAKKKRPSEITEYLRKLGQKGGKARLKTLTPEQRSEIARKAGKTGGRGRPKKTSRQQDEGE